MKDVQYIIYNNWALASDGLQWILQRFTGSQWRNLSFVRTQRDILARCMREKEMEPDHIDYFTARLPSTFDEWKTNAIRV